MSDDSAGVMGAGGHFPRLEGILGQDRAIATLARAVASSRVHHAWILSGPRGVGKFSAALAFAAALLDPATTHDGDRLIESAPDSPVRALIERGEHPDLHIVRKELARFSDDAGVRRRVLSAFPKDVIDQHLLRPASLAPTRNDGGLIRKAFIVDEAELLDRSVRHAPTQASMLKALEEPAPDTVIILVTSNEGRLLPTIRSRCQRLAFRLLEPDEMDRWIEAADVRGRIRALAGDELRHDVEAMRDDLAPAYKDDQRARDRGEKGTMSAVMRKRYELLDGLLSEHAEGSFAPVIEKLPDVLAKKLDGAIVERARTGPDDAEIAWLREFSAGSPGRLIEASATRLYEWHTELDPLLHPRSGAGGYEIGTAMKRLVDEWAKAHVKRGGRGEKRSKEAANLEAVRHMITLLGERADQGLRLVAQRSGTGDAFRDAPGVARMLGVVDAIAQAERRLSANVNLEQGLVALGAALRA